VERALYAFRLGEGTLQQPSQDLERLFGDRWGEAEGAKFHAWLEEGRVDRIIENAERLVSAHFSGDAARVEMSREELNLDQYRRVRRDESSSAPTASPPSGGNLVLKVSLEEDAGGVPARDISPGDMVRALLTDERDIAQYVSRLLGGRSPEGLKSLPAPVEEVSDEGDELRFQIRLSGSILGLSRVRPDARLQVDRRNDGPWWKRLFGIGG
jgi:hypothetical protein